MFQAVISSTDNLAKSELYWPLLPWLGTGLLTSAGINYLVINI